MHGVQPATRSQPPVACIGTDNVVHRLVYRGMSLGPLKVDRAHDSQKHGMISAHQEERLWLVPEWLCPCQSTVGGVLGETDRGMGGNPKPGTWSMEISRITFHAPHLPSPLGSKQIAQKYIPYETW